MSSYVLRKYVSGKLGWNEELAKTEASVLTQNKNKESVKLGWNEELAKVPAGTLTQNKNEELA